MVSTNELSRAEQIRLRLCRLVAFLAPLASLLICFGIFAAIDLFKISLPDQRRPVIIFLGNAVPGAIASAIAVLLLHPVPQRRRRVLAALTWLCLSPALYLGTFGLLLLTIAISEGGF